MREGLWIRNPLCLTQWWYRTRRNSNSVRLQVQWFLKSKKIITNEAANKLSRQARGYYLSKTRAVHLQKEDWVLKTAANHHSWSRMHQLANMMLNANRLSSAIWMKMFSYRWKREKIWAVFWTGSRTSKARRDAESTTRTRFCSNSLRAHTWYRSITRTHRLPRTSRCISSKILMAYCILSA